MLDKSRDKSRALIFLAAILLVAPISLATVTLSPNTVIEQASNDVDIAVDSEFNISSLSVYDNATQFGDTNFSITHTNTDLIQANMSKFNGSVGEGETVTSFQLNGSDGETVSFEFNNLTRRMYYNLYIGGTSTLNRSSGDNGEYTYSLDYSNNVFRDFELRAEAQDTIENSVSFSGNLTYTPNTSMDISGTGVYDISGDSVSNGNVTVYRNGEFVDSTTTDSNGGYNLDRESPKVAGYHNYIVNMSQHHLEDAKQREVTVDSLFLEDTNVTSLDTGTKYIDIDAVGALNISTRAYKNRENEIDRVRYEFLNATTQTIVPSVFGSWMNLKNTTDRTETGVWYNTTPSLADKGLGMGKYTIRLDAESQLNGTEIVVENRPKFNITIQDLDMNLELDQPSYSVNNDNYVNISGRAMLRPDDEPVSNSEVTIEIFDENGDGTTIATPTTNSTGHFTHDYAFTETIGDREVRVSTENENGIDGEASETFTVTQLSVDSILYDDSQVSHSYDVVADVSDSRGITNHECSLTVEDGSGNSESYNMSMDTTFGTENEARCTTPDVSYKNNSAWSPTEELTALVEVENGTSYAADDSTRQLPNARPEVTDYSLSEVQKSYEADVSAVAEDPNENRSELEACTVYYYSGGSEYNVSGNLDTTYGSEDEAQCTYSLNSGMEGISESENIEAYVEFEDKHGATGSSVNRTATLEANLNFEAEIRTLNGSTPTTTIELKDPDTGNVVTTLEGSGTISGTVAKGTYDMNVKTLNSEIEFNRAEIASDTSYLLRVEPHVEERHGNGITQDWPRNKRHIAVNDIDVPYDNVTIRFGYSGLDEQYITPWTCAEWNDDSGNRDCRETDFPYSELDYSPAADYDFLPEEEKVIIQTDRSQGAYVLASNNGWREGWFWRSEITVEGGDQDLRDYQVKFTVDTRESILEGNLDSECSNIRFYNTDQTQELDHWMEPGTCDSEDTVFWVEMPYIPANSERAVFMYYERDKDLESASSGEDTFIEFDEFDTNTLSNYDTAGTVDIEDGRLQLDSKNSEEASVNYTGSVDRPYRTHSVISSDSSAEEASVSTFIDSGNSVSYDIVNSVFSESYSDAQSSKAIDTGDWFSINQSVTGSTQRMNIEPAGESIELSGAVSDTETSPFGVGVMNDGDVYSSLDVERWFTTNYAESKPTTSITKGERLWELRLNGTADDRNIQYGSTMNIALNSSDYQSAVTVYKDDGVIGDSDDVEGIFINGIRFNENKTYEIRGEIDAFNETITHDVTVGQDNKTPNVTQADVERLGTNEMNFSYEVTDNYQGPIECQMDVNGQTRDTSRIYIDQGGNWYDENFYLTNAPHGQNSYNISCTDNFGNTESHTDSYSQDFRAPRIDFSVENGQTVWQVKPRINITLTDSYSENIDYEVYYEYDESSKITGTATNGTKESITMPTTPSYGTVDIIVEAKDDEGLSRTEAVTIDLNKPFVDLIEPQVGDEERRTIHNPGSSGNEEVLPETRAQTKNQDITYKFNYTNGQLDTTQCRLIVDGEEVTRGEYQLGTTGQFNVTLDEGINQKTRVECQTEVDSWVSGNEADRNVDIDNTAPEVAGIIAGKNNTDYTEDKTHSVSVKIADNLMAPSTSDTLSDYSSWFGGCSRDTSTGPHPYLEIDNTDSAIAMYHDFSGETQNETVELEKENYLTSLGYSSSSGCYTSQGSEPKDYAKKNFGNLPVGEYNFQIWAQDEVGNSVQSQEYTYKVNKGDPGISISSKNDRASDNTIVIDTRADIRCSAVTDQVSTTLTRNGITMDNSDDGETTLVADNNLTEAGTYSYECTTSGNENYTGDSTSRNIEVVETMEDEVNISIDGDFSNRTITYGNTATLDIKSRSGNHELFFDGENVNAPYTTSELEVGEYTVFGNSSGSYRFNESNKTRTLTVSKASNNLQLTSNKTINTVDNDNIGELGDWGQSELMQTTRGERPEIQCSSDTQNAAVDITRDGESVESGTGDISTVIDTSEVGTGFYRYNCEAGSTDNYKSSSDGVYVDISESPPPTFPESDGSEDSTVEEPFSFAGDSKEVNIERMTAVNVTCDPVEEEVSSTLYFEGEDVGIQDERTFDSTGFYDYTCVTETTPNYRGVEKTVTYDVMNKTSTELTIDGTTSDITVDQGEEVEIVGEVNESDTQVDLQDDRTSGERFWTDTDGTVEKTHTFSIPGEHTITAFHPEEADYFRSSDSSVVTVQDVNAPEIELISPNEGDIWDHNEGWNDNNDYGISYRSRDYSPHTCTTKVNGSVVSERSDGTNDDYSWDRENVEDYKSSGVYEYQVICEDEHGNRASSETVQFRLDNQDPSIEINEDPLVQTGNPSPAINVTTTDVSSTETTVELFTNSTYKNPDESEPFLDGGTRIARSTGDTGTRLINTDQLSPGLYNISAKVTDEVGNDRIEEYEFELRIRDNVTLMNPRNPAEDRTYVNSSDPELSFKYYSKQAPLTCDIDVDGNTLQTIDKNNNENGEDTWINNTVTELGGSELGEGQHTWSVTCGAENSDTFEYDSEFYVDTTDPDFEWTYVDRSSGQAYTGEPLTFDAQVSDNYEIENVTLTAASNLTTKQMFCGADNQCTANLELEPGQHHYNYTVCDAAGNCQTTETTEYEILDDSNSMNLYLNGERDNITITEDPIVNITGEFVSPKEGNVYFYVNDSLTGRCSRGSGCTIEENFLTPNGTYKIDAEFYSITDYTTNREQYWVNAQVPEDEFEGFTLNNLPPGKNATLRANPVLSVLGNAFTGNKDVLLGNDVGQDLAAQLNIEFSRDIDASDMSFDTNRSARKSFIHLETAYNRVLRKDLLVPREDNTGNVRVCPGAASLEEVSYTCEGGYNISTGESVGQVSMEEVTINGQDYYELTGITGTGGQEISTEDTENMQNRPAEVEVKYSETLNEFQTYIPDEDLDLDGGNVTTANLSSVQSTDNWAGLYGNATGNLVLGSDNIFYNWDAEPQLVLAANDTINWQNLSTPTPTEIDDYYGLDGSDRAEVTLDTPTEVTLGNTTYENAPSARTYNGTEIAKWVTATLSDGTTPVFVGKTRTDGSTAFTGEVANYQMMIPTGGDKVVPYSLYMDLE